jgi:hypothetical protein
MFLSISKRPKQAPWSPSLRKPLKPPKTKNVAKLPLKKQHRNKAHICLNPLKTLAKPYNYPLGKSEQRGEKKG